MLVTTNRSFTEWKEVFPNAACVVCLVDRLAHRAEVTVSIPGVWTPEQALAVLDPRGAIWTRYGRQVQPLSQGFQGQAACGDEGGFGDDPSF